MDHHFFNKMYLYHKQFHLSKLNYKYIKLYNLHINIDNHPNKELITSIEYYKKDYKKDGDYNKICREWQLKNNYDTAYTILFGSDSYNIDVTYLFF